MANGRFAPGWSGGPGNTSARINIARLARRKATELGLDLDALVWDVTLAMVMRASCGDVAAARLVYDVLGELAPKGPLVEINAGPARPPALPPLEPDGTGAPTLAEHLERLVSIAHERGLTTLGERLKPAEVVRVIADKRAAEKELLS